MLKVSLTAGALAVAMLVAMTVGKAQAALKPEIAKTEGVTLVAPGGGGGFGGGGGARSLAASVVAAAVCAGATSAVAGCQCARCAVATSDQKLAPSAAAFRCSTGAVTVTKFSDFSGRKGADDCQHRKFADDFKHRRFDKFRRFAIYGVPYL